MKTQVFKVAFAVLLFSIFHSNVSFCQNSLAGIWEGKFMNDFQTMIEIKTDENNHLSGKIRMFSGTNLIQDDVLSDFTFHQNTVTFRIESKDTDFKGELKNDNSTIKGVFIFPDKSEHLLELTKTNSDSSAVESSAKLSGILNDRKFSIKELHDDFDFLIGKLRKYHPQLYEYISIENFNEQSDEIKRSINEELSLKKYFYRIAPIVESIKCSHTGIRLPEEVQNAINLNDNFFPLELFFDGSNAYCIKNHDISNNSIKPGDEILGINNHSIQKITDELSRFIPAEGKNTSSKVYHLNRNFNHYFNLVDNSGQFEVEFLSGETIKESLLKACGYSVFEKQNGVLSNQNPFEFYSDMDKKTGYLTVRSFMIGDINSYILKMDDIFRTLGNNDVQHLVIDVRGNTGGHPIFAAQLFSYLTDRKFVYFERNNEVKDFEPLYNEMNPSEINFKGDVFVIVDGGCLSTTGHLISLLKDRTNAVFVGEDPGSTYRCNDYSIKQTLPNTGIEVNIPRTTFETAVSDSFKSTPFVVDYKISNSIDDHLSGTDGFMEVVNRIISEP